MCKVNAENYSDHASSTQTQQNKKSSFIMLPVHELSKKRSSTVLRGEVQSLIKVRGSDSKAFSKSGSAVKMLLRADTKSHFWHPRADTIPHFDNKIKTL